MATTTEARPLVLVSPNNAWAISIYAQVVILGISYNLNPAQAKSLVLATSPWFVQIWAMVTLVAALVGGVSAMSAGVSKNYRRFLTLEAIAALVVGAFWAVYATAVFMAAGQLTSGVALVGLIASGGLFRFAQAARDLARDRQATRKNLLLVHVSLADPKGLEE